MTVLKYIYWFIKCIINKFIFLIELGEINYLTSRFLGYSLYISNSTNKDDGALCFKDTNYTRNTIPNRTNTTCAIHGRYVIFYNNRTYTPFPDGYSLYAFSDLCEVKFMVRVFIFKRPMFVHVRYLIEKIDDHMFVCIPLEILNHDASNIWKHFTYHKHCFNFIWYIYIFNVSIRMSNTRILWRGLLYTVSPELSGRSLSHHWGNMSGLYRWI